jgi:hypothetical protein
MKKDKLPSLISVLILTLITVVMWVSFDIYRAVTKAPESIVPAEITKTLNPTLDQDSIKLIESKKFLSDFEIPEDIISSSPIPATRVIPDPTTIPTVEELSQSPEPIESTNSGAVE